jgi:dihydroorotate dehydrogenase
LYKEFVSPILDHLDSETGHHLALNFLNRLQQIPGGLELLRKLYSFEDPKLEREVLGLKFKNPVGVAAGLDKNGVAVASLHALGFSFVIVGSVTLEPQEGNPKPRQWYKNGMSFNSLGFPSQGAKEVNENLNQYKNRNGLIGISIGRNKNTSNQDAPKEYAKIMEILYGNADFFELGISSPNTVDLGELQKKDYLHAILQATKCDKPVFIKISPDLTLRELDDVIDLASYFKVGIAASNTTKDPNLKLNFGEEFKNKIGGFGGNSQVFSDMSTRQIIYINGQVPVIGIGGINGPERAREKFDAGASLVAINTALREKGLGIAGLINRGIL